ncbi:uncharacterized protein LOC120012604 [Tripterygium wilfordii]|uniref:uncharacterized protein LOC120012604 n=1 Tax=Tripterygium wilfordii TaxID=458696 RepID=UPI0018F7F3F7|nr:uncharacterized protein LOC120012604 [Tripterygium wilfordii]
MVSKARVVMEPTAITSLVLGAALGLVVNEMYRVSKEAVERCDLFHDELEYLKSTIKIVTPTINQIDQSRNRNSYPREVVEEIETSKKLLVRANDLVMTCSDIRRRKVWKTYRCTKKIRTLHDSLRAHLTLLLGVLNHVNQMKED